MAAEFVGTCVHLKVKDLDAYDDTASEIGYNRFRHYVGDDVIEELEQSSCYAGSGITLESDHHINYTTGKWKGEWAVCMHWSSIHHIWLIDQR